MLLYCIQHQCVSMILVTVVIRKKNEIKQKINVRDRAWFVRRDYESTSFRKMIIDRTGAQAMLFFTCTMICSVDLTHYRVYHAKDLGI